MTAPERPQAETRALRLPAKALESPELLTELLAALSAELPPEKERARLGLTPATIDALESACSQAAELAAGGKMSGAGTVRVHMGADDAPVMVEVHADSGGASAQNTSPAAISKYVQERAARAKAGAKRVVVEVSKAAPAAPAEPPRTPAAIAASRRLLASRVAPTEPAPAGAARASQMPTPAVPLPAAAHSRLAEGSGDTKDAPPASPPAPTGKKSSKPKDE